jgi:hypothetical protein
MGESKSYENLAPLLVWEPCNKPGEGELNSNRGIPSLWGNPVATKESESESESFIPYDQLTYIKKIINWTYVNVLITGATV